MTPEEKHIIISKEIKELTQITKDIPKDKRTYIDRLINQAAFMFAILSELQQILLLNKSGAVELFEQGAQKMLREHPAAKTYNSMIKNYSSIIKLLGELTPQEEEDEDPLKDFLNKKGIK